jgi:hypothetical protein
VEIPSSETREFRSSNGSHTIVSSFPRTLVLLSIPLPDSADDSYGVELILQCVNGLRFRRNKGSERRPRPGTPDPVRFAAVSSAGQILVAVRGSVAFDPEVISRPSRFVGNLEFSSETAFRNRDLRCS